MTVRALARPLTSTTALLVRRNLRKGRTQLAVVGLLAVVAGALLNLAALCGIRYPETVDASAARLRAPEVFVITPRAFSPFIVRELEREPDVSRIETAHVLSDWGTMQVDGTTLDTLVVYLDLDRQTDMGRTRVVERSATPVADPVYLPYLFKATGGYELGDAFTVKTPKVTRTYHVAGFVENTYLGFITMGATGIALPHNDFQALSRADVPPVRTDLVQARVPDPELASSVSARITAHSAALAQPGGVTWAWDRDLLSGVALTGPAIYTVSLVLFTLVVTLVVLMVIWFWIRGTIAHDLRAIGVLSTVGTDPRRVARSLAVPPTLVVLAGSLLGVAASYAAVPGIATSLAGQTGTPWRPAVDTTSGLVTVAVLGLAAYLLARVAVRRVRGLRPVEALAGGTAARSFRRNWLPLDTTRGTLHLLLGLKQGLANRAQSAMVVGVLLVVGFGTMFSAALFTNVLGNRDAFMRMTVGDLGDVSGYAGAHAGDRADLLRTIRATPGVEGATYKDFLPGTAGGLQIVAVVMDDFGEQRWSSVFRGREPRHANEIAIGDAVAKRAGVEIGETVPVRVGAATHDYLVVGTVSTIQFMGMRANLTTDGYRRLVPHYQHTDLDIRAASGVAVPTVIRALRLSTGARLDSLTNQRESVDAQFGVYVDMMGVLAWGILAVTVVVAGLVVGLMVATVLSRERVSFGVRKAVGFGGGQLVRQLVASYLPAVVIGVGLGCLVGVVTVPPFLRGALTLVGVAGARLETSPAMVSGLGVGLVGLAAVTATLGATPLLRRRSLELMRAE